MLQEEYIDGKYFLAFKVALKNLSEPVLLPSPIEQAGAERKHVQGINQMLSVAPSIAKPLVEFLDQETDGRLTFEQLNDQIERAPKRSDISGLSSNELFNLAAEAMDKDRSVILNYIRSIFSDLAHIQLGEDCKKKSKHIAECVEKHFKELQLPQDADAGHKMLFLGQTLLEFAYRHERRTDKTPTVFDELQNALIEHYKAEFAMSVEDYKQSLRDDGAVLPPNNNLTPEALLGLIAEGLNLHLQAPLSFSRRR